ncbi:MAG TPA: NAD(P)/FAD-dependent oxidoreductase [Myxococcota bacterium]|jgi:flavin-dependent dehydrogenase|nr:NAD(P)/FAD-dependent oxidoreductase [Myxococcota bacterium]
MTQEGGISGEIDAARPARARYDAIVIGGGPAGSTVSAMLAMKGRRVLLIEKEQFPRFHIGESLLPYNNKILRRLGVFEDLCADALIKWGAHFVAPDGCTEQTYYFKDTLDKDEPHAFEVERAKFDDLLLRNAQRKGVEVRERCAVEEVLFDGDQAVGVRARDLPPAAARPDGGRGPARAAESFEVRAPFVVDASGRDTFLSVRLGWKKRDLPISKTAFFTHWDGVERLPGRDCGNITIATWQHGWTWMIPLHRDGLRMSVGIVCHKDWVQQRGQDETQDQFYVRTLQQSPAVWARFAAARQLMPSRTIADISYRCERYAGSGFVLVGDAGSFMDPIFSSGVHLAMTGGALCADAIDRGLTEARTDPRLFAAYEAHVRAATETFFRFIYAWYTPGLHRVFYTPTRKLKILETVTSMLAGDVWDWKKRLRMEVFFGVLAFERFMFRLTQGPEPEAVWRPQAPGATAAAAARKAAPAA